MVVESSGIGGSQSLKVWPAANHEVVEVVVRRQYEPYDKMLLRERTGRTSRWAVLSAEKDPHGWRVTAMRCLRRSDSSRSWAPGRRSA
jgi:hypothetical protein